MDILEILAPILLIVLLASVLIGVWRGLVFEVLSVAGWVAAFFLAQWYADEAAAWLRAHAPIDYVPGLMHGDYQFANVMYRHGAPATLTAIVDTGPGSVMSTIFGQVTTLDKQCTFMPTIGSSVVP
jgi:hypothetical protein